MSAQLLPHGDRAQGEALAKNVCAACHRADGNSVDPDYPKLAGQSARYLYDQLLAFKAQGHRRASGVMGAMAVNLTDVQMRDVSAYFAAQLPRDTGPQNAPASPKLAAQGQSIYRQGIGGSAPFRHAPRATRSAAPVCRRSFRAWPANTNSTWSTSSPNSARIDATAIPAR